MDLYAALDAWRLLLGDAQVILGQAVQQAYGADTGASERELLAALRILDADLLSDVMVVAARFRVPVYPISTGRNWGYGTALPAQDGCVIIDLSALKKILSFDAELGVVTVEPGVTQGQLAEFLESGKHPYMVPVTGAGPACSLLGNALERGYGITPYTDHFQAVTNLEAVLADGSLYRTAMSEIAGEDLAKLFKWGVGPYASGLFSQGGFGIVTSASILLARKPDYVCICLFNLPDDALLEEVVIKVQSILSSLPGTIGGINIMNCRRILAMTAPYPLLSVGDDGLIPPKIIDQMRRSYKVAPWTGLVTLYGSRRIVAAARKDIQIQLERVASRILFLSAKRIRLAKQVFSKVPFIRGRHFIRTLDTLEKSLQLVNGRPNNTALPLAYWRNRSTKPCTEPLDPARDGCGIIWYAPLIPMRAKNVRQYVDMVTAVTTAHGIEPLITLTSVSERVFSSSVPLLFDKDNAKESARAKRCYSVLLDEGQKLGFFPYRLGIEAMHKFQNHCPAHASFIRRLKKGIDPNNLIAPSRY